MSAKAYRIPAIQNLQMDASVTLPGSKSIALRQLAMAALAQGTSTVTGVPVCDDTDAMLDCLRALGVEVLKKAELVEITGPMDYVSDVQLNARMSGASTRLLIGLAALRHGRTSIDGHASLQARTNQPLLDVLARYGCEVTTDNGGLPLSLKGPFKPPATLEIDGSLSSQYVTALLIAAPYASDTATMQVKIIGDLVSRPYIDITLNEMAKRNVVARWVDDRTIEINQALYPACDIQVEGDATAATYFAALATLHGGAIELTNLGQDTQQGDYRFLRIMEELGASVERHSQYTRIVGPAQLKALQPQDMTAMPDAALTLIALAPLLPARTQIEGLNSLHHKECDRLERPADEFKAMGIDATTTQDTISIEPVAIDEIQEHTLRTYHDHRMAMAFSLIGSCTGVLEIDDKNVVDKTYPNYWLDYAKVAVLRP